MSDLYKQIADLPPEKRELFELMLQEQGVDLSGIMITPLKRERDSRFPLSFSQQRLWFLDRLEPDSYLYNINTAVKISGRLDKKALERTINEIIRRHEVLRTHFTENGGEPEQVIRQELNIRLEETDLEELPEQDRDTALNEHLLRESKKPFDLKSDALMRIHLFRLQPAEHVFFMSVHHIVSDNWSTGLLVNEIMQIYSALSKGEDHHLQALPVQYADYAAWQRKWLQGKTLEKQLDYWKKELDSAPPILEFPLDHPRPSFQTYNGDFILFQIPSEVRQQLKTLCSKADVTEFMVLLAVFILLLHKYSGQDDICVGTPIANRNRSETEQLIGFFINTLVIRGNLEGDPAFTDLLARIKERTLGALDHQDIPFETLVEALQPERDMSHSPFFQTMFVLNNAPVRALELEGLKMELLEIENKTSKFDLIFNLTETEKGFSGKLEFNTDLFEKASMNRFREHYLLLLERVLEDTEKPVSEYSLITPEDRIKLDEWASSGQIYDETGIVLDMIRKTVVHNADAPALRILEEAFDYGQLLAQSQKLAVMLQREGVENGTVVGISLPRSSALIISLLAVWQSGGMYLPLDPQYPQERLNFMLEDASAGLLISDSGGTDRFAGCKCKHIAFDTIFNDSDISETATPLGLPVVPDV
jgi:hypothetical protein